MRGFLLQLRKRASDELALLAGALRKMSRNKRHEILALLLGFVNWQELLAFPRPRFALLVEEAD